MLIDIVELPWRYPADIPMPASGRAVALDRNRWRKCKLTLLDIDGFSELFCLLEGSLPSLSMMASDERELYPVWMQVRPRAFDSKQFANRSNTASVFVNTINAILAQSRPGQKHAQSLLDVVAMTGQRMSPPYSARTMSQCAPVAVDLEDPSLDFQQIADDLDSVPGAVYGAAQAYSHLGTSPLGVAKMQMMCDFADCGFNTQKCDEMICEEVWDLWHLDGPPTIQFALNHQFHEFTGKIPEETLALMATGSGAIPLSILPSRICSNFRVDHDLAMARLQLDAQTIGDMNVPMPYPYDLQPNHPLLVTIEHLIAIPYATLDVTMHVKNDATASLVWIEHDPALTPDCHQATATAPKQLSDRLLVQYMQHLAANIMAFHGTHDCKLRLFKSFGEELCIEMGFADSSPTTVWYFDLTLQAIGTRAIGEWPV